MRFSDREVRTDSGETVPLSSFWNASPVAFIFLRHLGCIFCKQHVATFRGHPELHVVFVCLGAPSNAAVFKKTMGVTNTFICDPEKLLYDEAGLRTASLGQILNPRIIAKGIAASFSGLSNSRSSGDPMVLGGSFVVNTDGDVTFEHRAKDASDNSTVDSIRAALRQ